MTSSKPAKSDNTGDDAVAEVAAYWQAREASGQMNADDRQRFADWLSQNQRHEKIYQEIAGLWQHPGLTSALSAIPLSSPRRNKHQAFTWRKFALPLVCSSALLTVVFLVFQPLLLLQADYVTNVGEQLTVHLSDGSDATLNTGSALKVSYTGNERRVQLLQGEAYFAVTKNPDRPFAVDSGESVVRVLGTRFTVRNDSDTQTVTVSEGRVEVSAVNQQRTVLLTQGQSVTVSSAGLTAISPASASANAWLGRHLVFDNVALSTVIRELDRYLPGTVVLFGQSELDRIQVNARLNIKEPGKALEALALSLPIRLTHAGPWLTIIRPDASAVE